MKTNLMFQVFFIALISCNKSDKIKPVQVAACEDPLYTRTTELVDVETFVVAKNFVTPFKAFTSYYLDQPDAAGLTIPYVPCNLPKEFQKDKLKVRFSGYRLTFRGSDSANSVGAPIEMTQIEEQ